MSGPLSREEFDDTRRSLASGSREVNRLLSGSICDALLGTDTSGTAVCDQRQAPCPRSGRLGRRCQTGHSFRI